MKINLRPTKLIKNKQLIYEEQVNTEILVSQNTNLIRSDSKNSDLLNSSNENCDENKDKNKLRRYQDYLLVNCRSVSDFDKIEEIGEGTYGRVCKIK